MSAPTALWTLHPAAVEEPLHHTVYQGYGYYPLQLGETIGEHFKIVRKLGWAGSSSVWLARDCSEEQEVYAAVKVMTQNASLGVASERPSDKCYEVEVLKKIGDDRYESHPALKHCTIDWEMFIAYSTIPAVHLCIAMRPCAGTLRELQLSLLPLNFPLGPVKRVTRQCLLALRFLHEDLHFIHGDVQANNVMVDFDPSGDYLDISRRIGEYIARNPPETHSSGPSVPAKSQPLGNLGSPHRLDYLSVRLADYGSALPIDMTASGRPLQTPLHSRAPEMLLGHPLSTAVDLWAVGCMVYALLFDRPLFHLEGIDIEDHEQVIEHLSQMARYLGPFPASVVSRDRDQSNAFFDEEGVLKQQVNEEEPLECRFRSDAAQARGDLPLSDADIHSTLDFLGRCFALEPRKRATAVELLDDPWLEV